MACSTNTKRIVSIAHGAVGLVDPVGGSIDREVQFGRTRPGVRKSPALWVNEVNHRARGDCQQSQTPIAVGTKASLVFTLQKLDEAGNVGVTITNMRAGNVNVNLDQEPHRWSHSFEHDSGDTDDLAPVSVS